MMDFEEHARRYVNIGWYVFPLAPGSKKPRHGSHGLADATRDPVQIKAWGRECPDANLAILTGPESNLSVVDLDVLKGGFDSERHLRAQGKTWPTTWVQRTQSRGRHIVLQYHPLIVTGSHRLGAGIDFRGRGGYFVASPSVVGGKSYSWLSRPTCGPAPAPGWLISNLSAEAARKQADRASPAKPLPAVLEPEIERVRNALRFIPSDDRETWLAVGMALSASFGENGRSLWDAWSRQSARYTDVGQAKAWKSFNGASRTIGTIFWLRRQYRGRAPIYSL